MTAIAGIATVLPLQAAPRAAGAMLAAIGATEHAPTILQDGQVSLGAQRMTRAERSYSDARFFAVADSTIENRRELCDALGLRESVASDAAVIVAAYAAWGRGCLPRIKGEYAFAIWDRTACELFCARDRFGVRPLYYRQTDRSFRFGSEAKTLSPDTDRKSLALNQAWLVDLSAGLVTDVESTVHTDILRLPPAHTLRWQDGRLRVERYWSFDDMPRATQGPAAERLREAFEKAVEARLSTATGAFLSGGLDSTSVCCVASDIRTRTNAAPLRTVSIVFDATPGESERAHIETVLKTGRYDARIVNVTSYRPLPLLARLTSIQDGPFLGPGVPLMDQAYAAARFEGLTSVLDGHGGDEVVSSGMTRLNDLARARSWGRLAWEAGIFGIRHNMNPLGLVAGYAGQHGQGLSARILRGVARRTLSLAPPTPHPGWLAETWREDGNTLERHQAFRRSTSPPFDGEQEYHRAVLSSPLQPYGFEVLANISRHHGLESRFPFWDEAVVEACVRAPSSAKLANGWPRALLRAAMKETIPESIRRRTDKLDFSGHMVRGLLADKSMLLDIAGARGAQLGEFIDLGAFVRDIDDLEHPDVSCQAAAAARLMRGAALAIWLDSRSSTTQTQVQLECQA